MSLFSDLAGQVLSSAGGASQGDALQHIMGFVQQQGGIGAIVEKFHASGLGGVAQSWVGTGTNQPVSGDQLHQVFGSDQIRALAQRAGVDPSQITGLLAKVLPGIVDHLTPNGQVPPESEVQNGLAALLQKGLGGLFGS